MKVLFIGDVVGSLGCKFLKENLLNIKNEYKIDIVIANGENSSNNNGITPSCAEYMFNTGVDIISTGNHIFKQKRSIWEYLNRNKKILRPANYPKTSTPGAGFLKFSFNNFKFCVINILGILMLEPLSCPFETLDSILNITNDCLIKIVDFHAEATSEKRAFGFYASDKVSAVFGTHTHVQTNDAQIIPPGMAYITDVGMTGSYDSVLGVKKEISIKRLKEKIPLKFEQETEGICKMNCVIAEFNENTGKALKIETFNF